MASSSSLSSVVSNLVRASMGTSVSNTVTDEDLDRHIAELILKEAKKKAQNYSETGIRALLRNGAQPDSNVPRANKRFLSSIIRSTDDHNKTILRAQALAAQEIKRERAEQERRDRRARAEEAVQARRKSGKTYSSASSSSSRRKRSGEDYDYEDGGGGGGVAWDRWDGRTADRKRKARDWETWDGEDEDEDEERDRRKSSTRRSRSRERRREKGSSKRSKHDRSRSRERRRSDERPSIDRRSSRKHRSHRSDKSRRRRSTSRSRTRSFSPSTSRKRSPKYALDDEFDDYNRDERPPSRSSTRRSPSQTTEDNTEYREAELRHRLVSTRPQPQNAILPSSSCTRAARSPSRSPSPKRHKPSPSSSQTTKTSSPTPRSPTPVPEPSTQPQPPSKMDKYFEETYDPRLDVAPLTVPQVPATGLINNADFEGWDAMLELIRMRREDKEEKKRLERLGLTKEKVKEKKKGVVVGDSGVASRWNGEGVSIMNIEYKKRGTVREWDLGKEGF